MNKKMTKKQRENLAKDIFNFLVENKLWVDTSIYFNGKCWSTSNKNQSEFCYNENRYFEYEADPRDYFGYVNPDTLSMSFEGDLYDVLNGYCYGWANLEEQFMNIFDRYGVYYELGNAWNLSVYF